MKSPKNIQASQVNPAAPQLFGRLGGVQHTCEPIPQMKRQLIAQGDGSDECKHYHVIKDEQYLARTLPMKNEPLDNGVEVHFHIW